MKLTALAAASVAALALTGCTVSPPTTTQPQTPPTVQQSATTTVPDEAAYLDGLARCASASSSSAPRTA